LAPALEKVIEAFSVVAVFAYAYTIAGGVIYQSNAYPFVIGAPNERRLCMVEIQAWTLIYATNVKGASINNF
jgi:hypothetical protein